MSIRARVALGMGWRLPDHDVLLMAGFVLCGYRRGMRLESERVVVQSPLSFVGSARRLWRLTDVGPDPWAKVVTIPLAVLLVAAAWVFVAAWTAVFGLLLVPYRLVRRGGRRRKQEGLRHREMLNHTRG